MKRKQLSLIVLLCLILLSFIGVSQIEIEHEMVEQIKQNTHETAENTSKGYVEYISFGTAVLACAIAFITLLYSRRTYQSQKQTEKNTRKWSVKQERVVLRQLGWKLFISYAKLISIERTINSYHSKKLSSTNFLRMKIDPSYLHLDDFYERIENYDDLSDLYNEIIKFNTLLDRRIDQTEHLMLKECSNVNEFYVDMSYTNYFTEEKQVIRSIFKKIDSVYPYFFEVGEKRSVSDSWETKVSIVENASNYYDSSKISMVFREQYICESSTPLSNFDILINIEEADKYFPIPYISFYNCVINARNKKTSDKVADLLEESGQNQAHRLPLKDDYIEKIFQLIEEDLIGGLHNIYFINDTNQTLEYLEQFKDSITRIFEHSRLKKEDLITVYDESSGTLYTYVDKSQFQLMVSFKQNHYTYYISEKDLSLFFKHDNGQIIYSEGVTDKSFVGCINIYDKEKLFPYTKKEIKRLAISYVTEFCNDMAIFDLKKVKYSLSPNKDKWKVMLMLGELKQFIRR